VVRVVALRAYIPRPAFSGRFAAKTAAASDLPHLFRSRNSAGLPSSYPPPGPQSFAVGICGVGTRLAVTTAQSGVAVNSQGTDSYNGRAAEKALQQLLAAGLATRSRVRPSRLISRPLAALGLLARGHRDRIPRPLRWSRRLASSGLIAPALSRPRGCRDSRDRSLGRAQWHRAAPFPWLPMSANGSVEVYLGATEPYVGDFDSTETYELHSISCKPLPLSRTFSLSPAGAALP
jgi:hypothetical protein